MLVSSNLTSCQEKKYPANLSEAVTMLLQELPDNVKNDFKDRPENEAVLKLHMSTGMWIRNSWIRHGNKSLSEEFQQLGIRHPDDMSSIILTTAHRKLNNMSLNVSQQVQHFKDYWKPIIESNERSKKTALETYNNRKLGDTIKIYYPVSVDGNYKNAVIYENNENWIFDPKRDLEIRGIITEKYFLGSETNVFFKLKIIEKNFEDIPVLMQEMLSGETYSFNLDKLRIE